MTVPFIIASGCLRFAPTYPASFRVAAYALQSRLPGELKGNLPTAKQLADIVRAEMEGGK